jgi:NACHT domain
MRQAMRWTATLAAALVGLLLVWLAIRLTQAYVSDNSELDKAGYLGTITGCIGLVVAMLQFLRWLRRQDSPESVAAQLRVKTGTELDRRLSDMRRTSEDIALSYRVADDSRKTGLDGLVDRLLQESGRVILTGQPGVGKSYTALQVAAELIKRNPSVVPLVIPLSRWTDTGEPTSRLVRFVGSEFNLAASSADALLRTGKVLPVFDGLDELCSDDADVEPAADLLRKLIDWRNLGSRMPFFLACRRSIWDRIDRDLASHHSLAVFSILAVNRDEARKYLARSVSGTDQTGAAEELIQALQQKGHGSLPTSPWQLSLVAEIARSRPDRSGRTSIAELERIADLANINTLIEYYVESLKKTHRWTLSGMRREFDYLWLSNYARYLESNRLQQRSIAGHDLPTRDIMLHRLWPVAGSRAPRIVDLVICIILSAPGFYWAEVFLWHRGLLARLLLIFFSLIWLFLLVRTSTKPWVRSATPNWSRLTDPKFFLRQLGAAVVIGGAAWLTVGPVVAAVCFVTAWLVIGLTVGFGQTLATDVQPRVVGPLGVLRRERQVSRFSAAAVFPILAAGFSSTWGAGPGIAAAFGYCLIVGETVACALWRRYLAMIIASAFKLPLAPAHCLERMRVVGHMRIAGRSYQFRHDDVLHYFAQRHGLRGARSEISAGA